MTSSPIDVAIDGLFLGKVETRWEGRAPSAIHKTPAFGPLEIGETGFVQDAQADLKVHGGRDKAIHHYASDHYATWIAEGALPDGTLPAAFGENVATQGLTEEQLCIGDILRLGSAMVQVSQGRQPCWKVAAYTDNPRMATLFTKTVRTGWYYRVLEPGTAKVGDRITLVERLHPEWSVARTTAALLLRKATSEDAALLADMPELSDDWRESFQKLPF